MFAIYGQKKVFVINIGNTKLKIKDIHLVIKVDLLDEVANME